VHDYEYADADIESYLNGSVTATYVEPPRSASGSGASSSAATTSPCEASYINEALWRAMRGHDAKGAGRRPQPADKAKGSSKLAQLRASHGATTTAVRSAKFQHVRASVAPTAPPATAALGACAQPIFGGTHTQQIPHAVQRFITASPGKRSGPGPKQTGGSEFGRLFPNSASTKSLRR
jgi:hypothetical protein